jgi:hypothetical protein
MYINDQRGFREYGMMDVGLIWGGGRRRRNNRQGKQAEVRWQGEGWRTCRWPCTPAIGTGINGVVRSGAGKGKGQEWEARGGVERKGTWVDRIGRGGWRIGGRTWRMGAQGRIPDTGGFEEKLEPPLASLRGTYISIRRSGGQSQWGAHPGRSLHNLCVTETVTLHTHVT